MQGGVVECISGEHLCGVIAVTRSEGFVVVLAHGLRASVFALVSDETYVVEVWYTAVDVVEETGYRVALEVERGADAVETVDNHHGALLLREAAYGECLAREALTAVVYGRHAERVYRIARDRDDAGGIVDHAAVVEPCVTAAGVDYVTFGAGRLFEGIDPGTPAEPYGIAGQGCGKSLDGQRLYDILLIILICEILQNTLVYGAAYGEPETRVEAVTHVGEILV